MYEQIVVHAIQHPKHNGFVSRYVHYGSREERDRTFDLIKKQHSSDNEPIERVTLTITAITAVEQETLALNL